MILEDRKELTGRTGGVIYMQFLLAIICLFVGQGKGSQRLGLSYVCHTTAEKLQNLSDMCTIAS